MTRVAVVTGAAGAMGSACAEVLAEGADTLVLTDLDADGLATTAARLPAEVVTLVGDLADPTKVVNYFSKGRSRRSLGSLELDRVAVGIPDIDRLAFALGAIARAGRDDGDAVTR